VGVELALSIAEPAVNATHREIRGCVERDLVACMHRTKIGFDLDAKCAREPDEDWAELASL
jgi:hypothetical protein